MFSAEGGEMHRNIISHMLVTRPERPFDCIEAIAASLLYVWSNEFSIWKGFVVSIIQFIVFNCKFIIVLIFWWMLNIHEISICLLGLIHRIWHFLAMQQYHWPLSVWVIVSYLPKAISPIVQLGHYRNGITTTPRFVFENRLNQLCDYWNECVWIQLNCYQPIDCQLPCPIIGIVPNRWMLWQLASNCIVNDLGDSNAFGL